MRQQQATLIYHDGPAHVSRLAIDDPSLWLATDNLTRAAGWELKPEGLCHGETCVPVAFGAERLVRAEDGETRVNLAELAARLGMPVVHDAARAVWYIGEPAERRREEVASLTAPNFSLPDLAGHLHQLADQRGKKVLLAAWASW